MFFPLKDKNPLKVIRFQAVTLALISINVLVFLYTNHVLDEHERLSLFLSLGMVPASLSGNAVLSDELYLIPALLTPFTSIFLHGGWMHLVGNMAFLWVFADNVEDSFGHIPFLLFYLFCGVVAAMAHLVLDPASQIPLIGASGAISGVIASYLLLFPRSQVTSLFGFVPLRMSAMWLLGLWIVFNVASFLVAPTGGGVAWVTHLAGFLAGLAITWPLRQRIRLRLARGQARKHQREREAHTRLVRRGQMPEHEERQA